MGRSMTQAAIQIGAKMGVQLVGGTPVKASGNCLIESVKGNIEERDIFDIKLAESSLELRLKSAVEGERVIGESPYRIEDYNEDEWAQGWNLLKNEGIWDVEYFGDLMIIALAHYIHKNILLINTDPDSPNITVILGDQFGEKLDSDAPVILAYSGTHYESLIPSTREDEKKIKTIIRKYVTGEDPCNKNTNDENTFKVNSNIIETVKDDPRILIDNWECHNDDNNTRSLANTIGQLSLKSTEPVIQQKPQQSHHISTGFGDIANRASKSQLTGIDNWKHCYPGRGTNFRTTSHRWGEEEREATPIPIIRVKPTPKVITIPITRVNI